MALLNEGRNDRRANGGAPTRHGASRLSVALFEEAPELLLAVRPEDRAGVSGLRVGATVVKRGAWRPPTSQKAVHGHLGLLIVDGLVLRRVALAGRKGAELLGAGDLLQPWVRQTPYDTVSAEAAWEMLEPTRLAILDRRFAARVAPWPEIAAALITRAMDRARMLAFQHVASHIPGVDRRLLAMMWAFADRWGRVTREGIVIPLRLTHGTLAELVGASRPSVSTAVARLAREGVLNRTTAGWLLDAAAPDDGGAQAHYNGPAEAKRLGDSPEADVPAARIRVSEERVSAGLR